jgi:two-component system, NtrC family, response regulator AtoC
MLPLEQKLSSPLTRSALSAYGNAVYVAGASPAILPIQRLMSEIAPTDIPILIVGESGTGKEVIAYHIHNHSKYANRAFIKINCANINLETSQTDLREHEPGSEGNGDGAVGTVFFDEIGDLDADSQRQLLHSLPDGNGLGSRLPHFARLMSCTTREPEEDVQRGRLRSELFYRLNGVSLRLPPLRRRREDIPILVRHFLTKYARLFERPTKNLSAEMMEALTEYMWPGNIRELENVVKKIVALDNEELAFEGLRTRHVEIPLGDRIESRASLKVAARAASMKAERDLILQTLTRTHWNRKRAAEALQISYKSLLYKLKQIQVPDSDEV